MTIKKVEKLQKEIRDIIEDAENFKPIEYKKKSNIFIKFYQTHFNKYPKEEEIYGE